MALKRRRAIELAAAECRHPDASPLPSSGCAEIVFT
jgi:hypothetical protein